MSTVFTGFNSTPALSKTGLTSGKANEARAVGFIIRGAQKRRQLAFGKARRVQVEMGVAPRLVSLP